MRIAGYTTRRGARVRRLTVRARPGVTIVSRCVGHRRYCPYRKRTMRLRGKAGRTRTVHVRGFERVFRSGVLLRIYVAKSGRTGKFASFRIRRHRAPRRNDGCVAGPRLRPVKCPRR